MVRRSDAQHERSAARARPVDQLSPYEAVLRAFGYYERVTPEDHARRARLSWSGPSIRRPVRRDCLGDAVDAVRGRARGTGSTPQPDPLGRCARGPRSARSRPRPPATCLIYALALAHYSSARSSRPSGTQRSGPSRSTPWMESTLRRSSATCMAYRRRLGARLRLGKTGDATQPPSPGRGIGVLRFTRRVPQGRLPRRAERTSPRSTCRGSFYTLRRVAALYTGSSASATRRRKALRELLGSAARLRAGSRAITSGSGTIRTRRTADRRAPQGGPGDCPAGGSRACRSRPRTIFRGRLGRRARRRGLLGRGAAVQVRRNRRRSHGPGRWADRGDRDRPVALLLPAGDRARLDSRYSRSE